jgi:hypothetical protein
MLTTFADFLLGAALSRRPKLSPHPRRTPSRPRGQERAERLAWMSRVGTW